jgi:hypothetical protein
VPTAEETRRRVRAALALGGYSSVEELACALAERDSGIGLKRLRLIWQRGESRAVERREIADATGVPREFMEHGFAAWVPDGGDVKGRLDELEASQRQMRDQLEALVSATRRTTRALLGPGAPQAAPRTPGGADATAEDG